jgi:hypothetical protein
VLHLVILRFLELVHCLIFRKVHRVLGTQSVPIYKGKVGRCLCSYVSQLFLSPRDRNGYSSHNTVLFFEYETVANVKKCGHTHYFFPYSQLLI